MNTSNFSNGGNGSVLLTYPDPPLSLDNVVSISNGSVLGITWIQGNNNGGTAVIDY